jgi:hypothetical protein
MKTNKMTATQAHEKLQQGGMFWILFHGDEMDRTAFCEWAETDLSHADVERIEQQLAALGEDEALEVIA